MRRLSSAQSVTLILYLRLETGKYMFAFPYFDFFAMLWRNQWTMINTVRTYGRGRHCEERSDEAIV
jgi:hypothetical protein